MKKTLASLMGVGLIFGSPLIAVTARAAPICQRVSHSENSFNFCIDSRTGSYDYRYDNGWYIEGACGDGARHNMGFTRANFIHSTLCGVSLTP